MRDQYAGDISDFLKIALLRALVTESSTLGVGWYYNALNDGRPDGRRREYCQEPKWRVLDPALWNALRQLPQRSVKALEELSVWPAGTRFHRLAVPSMERRESWALDMMQQLKDSSIVLLDPDNGIGNTERHATIDEIATMRQRGRAIVLIKFPSRENHDRQLEAYHASLWHKTHCLSVATVRTTVWINQPTFRWFTMIDAANDLVARAERFVHALNQIDACKSDILHETRGSERKTRNPTPENWHFQKKRQASNPSVSEWEGPDLGQGMCPECGHRFRGKGFEGIDAHWRARHETIMPYSQAWPLIKSGEYPRSDMASRRARGKA